jgi:hypothetical protein
MLERIVKRPTLRKAPPRMDHPGTKPNSKSSRRVARMAPGFMVYIVFTSYIRYMGIFYTGNVSDNTRQESTGTSCSILHRRKRGRYRKF